MNSLRNSTQSNAARLPLVELPKVGRTESTFAQEIGSILKNHGVFLSGNAAVVIAPKTNRIETLTADCLRTYAEQFLRTTKLKRFTTTTPDGKTIIEDRHRPLTMTKGQAEAVLNCHQFLKQLPTLRRVSRVAIPILRNG